MADTKPRKLSHAGARQKGKRGEYKVRDELRRLGIDARRVPMSGALSWMKGDVAELNVKIKHVHEVKNCERLELHDWWRQARSQAKGDEVPVLHFSGNYNPTYTVMRVQDFDYLVSEYEFRRKPVTLNLIDVPSRKHFWKYREQHQTDPGQDVYLMVLDGDEVAAVWLQSYLTFRKAEAQLTAPMAA